MSPKIDVAAVSVYGFKVSFEDLTFDMKERDVAKLQKLCKAPDTDGEDILKPLRRHIRSKSRFFTVVMSDDDTDYTQNDFFLAVCDREVKDVKSPLYTKTDETGAIDEIADEDYQMYKNVWTTNEATMRTDFQAITGRVLVDKEAKSPSLFQWLEIFEEDGEE